MKIFIGKFFNNVIISLLVECERQLNNRDAAKCKHR